MPIARITEYLDMHRIKYEKITHSPAYTAQEVAAKAHVSGWDLAKTVVVKLDGEFAMAVLPASEHIDLDYMAEIVNAREACLATEDEFIDMFPGCDLGAIPPFGNLFGMKVFVAPELAEDETIAFSAGTHTELIRLSYDDFEWLVEPEMIPFAVLT
ncbi:YbaK/EbsC family protein [Pelagicoccus sp. SDUM812003]|uniref:aminoacyl-tRNA deacylase n=1 Tax=Pelagicoccus sp. SDUM812003 TaxID=3041267 RepID=UPI00280E0278|nr:YbaK/EbsC family protein [Pelagicoccus sp. SDUM812003]MDQ8204792.1 YbaK/EbsC family protein [Pelagicoccus sp. SDUM812003]